MSSGQGKTCTECGATIESLGWYCGIRNTLRCVASRPLPLPGTFPGGSAKGGPYNPTRKPSMAGSPTTRSLKWLRDMGWEACVVEKWNNHARIRQDAFGFGDLLACRPEEGTALIQTTSRSNLPARRKKVAENAAAGLWLASGGRIFLHGWYKKGRRWQVKYEEVIPRPVGYAETQGDSEC